MFLTFKTKEEKARVVWNYILRNMDISTEEMAKILYITDKKHFNTYGRSIYGENYLALPSGPVPITLKAYLDQDLNFYPYLSRFRNEIYIDRNDNKLRMLPSLNLGLEALSKSDLIAITEAADMLLKGSIGLEYQDSAWYMTPIHTIIDWKLMSDQELTDEAIEDLHFMSRHSI